VSAVVACPSCGRRNRVPASAAGHPRCAACHSDLPWIVDGGERDFDELARTNGIVLVDLWAPWCGPCKMVAPAVERAATELAGRLKVIKVDVDHAPGVSARFSVQGIPTLLLLREGKVIARQVGALPADRLIAWVSEAVAAHTPPGS
jgi:thioredoxin 2